MPRLTPYRFLFLFSIFAGIGAFAFFRLGIGHVLTPFPVQVYPHNKPFFYPTKTAELLGYLCYGAFAALYPLLILRMWRRDNVLIERIPQKALYGILAFDLLLNVLVWGSPHPPMAAAWSLVVAAPILAAMLMHPVLDERKLTGLVFGVSSIALVVMILPFVVLSPHIECEYLNVPTRTFTHQGATDTNAFLLDHSAIGLRKQSGNDARLSESQGLASIKMPPSAELQKLLDAKHLSISERVYHDVRGESNTSEDDDRDSIFYDPNHSLLVAHQPITATSDHLLHEILGPDHDGHLSQIALAANEQEMKWQSHQFTLDEQDFILKNRHEFVSQILARRIIHHHNFLLGAINEYALGRPLQDINMQYGALPVIGLCWLLQATGGIDYGHYFKILFSFYFLYFILAAIAIRWTTRSNLITTLYCAFSVIGIGLIGYDSTATAPGLNPFRHFFDVPVFLLLWSHIGSPRPLKKLLLYFLCLIAVCNNPQTGLFLLASVCATLAVLRFNQRKGWQRLPISEIVAACAGLATAAFLHIGRDELGVYYFEGLCGFPLKPSIVIMTLAMFSACYATAYAFWDRLEPQLRCILLSLLFYSQCMFLYYIWGGSRFHFLNYASVYGITVLAMLAAASRGSETLRQAMLHCRRPALIVAGITVLLAFAHYESEQRTYMNDFRTHVSQRWTSKVAPIVSTMPEEPFRASVELISRYAQPRGIYIISQYDNFLPYLAGHYSAMPFPDLQWFLNSESDTRRVINCIRERQPHYLFVDADIDRVLGYEIVDGCAPFISALHSESVLRVRRMHVLAEIFAQVRDDYVLREQKGLLAVWERRPTTPKL